MSITTLDCVLSRFSSLVFAVRTRARNQFWSLSLGTDKTPPHCHTLVSIQHFIFPLIFYPETPKAGSGPTNWRTVPSHASLSVISSPRTVPQNVEGPKRAPQSAGWKCSSTPFGIVVSMETLFCQPEELSDPPDYQSKY